MTTATDQALGRVNPRQTRVGCDVLLQTLMFVSKMVWPSYLFVGA